ncbi:hypothetical protein [Streptomyces longisporoflavus]|uniref:Uncharacterized protein n=1 Tax=Streptomyces longisporoflavus TaxID=28044 RepID=A0ABW7QZS7_9ACTN
MAEEPGGGVVVRTSAQDQAPAVRRFTAPALPRILVRIGFEVSARAHGRKRRAG